MYQPLHKQDWLAWISVISIDICFKSQCLFFSWLSRHCIWTADLLQSPLMSSVGCEWTSSYAVKCIVVNIIWNISREDLKFIMNLLQSAASPLICVWGHLKFIHWLLPQITHLSDPKPRLPLTSPYHPVWVPQWTLVLLPLLYLLIWLKFMAFCSTHVLV